MNRLYLDDMSVGMKFSSGTYLMDEAGIKAFAQQFDPQPFHLDEAAAQASVFKGLSASGWHTAAVSMRLLILGGLPFASGAVGLGGDIEWPRPTRPGDVLHVESEVAELTPSRSRTDRGMLVLRSRTINQHGDVVQSLSAKLIVARRPA